MVTRGFTGRPPRAGIAERLPPGQSLTEDFPVLRFGPTPPVTPGTWRFTLREGARPIESWDCSAINALPRTRRPGDIHCVTEWSKFDTAWGGVRFTGKDEAGLRERRGYHMYGDPWREQRFAGD